jgi:hypothetical protein
MALSLIACLPKPKQDYTVDQIPQINSLEEIMRVQAQTMDPLFAKRNQASYSADEFTAMAEAGRRIQVTSATVRDKFATQGQRKPSFATFAGQLNAQAGDLLAAADGKDAQRAAATLRSMKQTCAGCHKENR